MSFCDDKTETYKLPAREYVKNITLDRLFFVRCMFTVDQSPQKPRLRQHHDPGAANQYARGARGGSPYSAQGTFPRVVSDTKAKKDYFKTTVAVGCFAVALVSLICTLFFARNQGILRGQALAASENAMNIAPPNNPVDLAAVAAAAVANMETQIALAKDVTAGKQQSRVVETQQAPVVAVPAVPAVVAVPAVPVVVAAPVQKAQAPALKPVEAFDPQKHLPAAANAFPGRTATGLVVVTFTDFAEREGNGAPTAFDGASPGANTVTGGANDPNTQAAVLRSWARNARAASLRCLVMLCTSVAPLAGPGVEALREACPGGVAHAPNCAVNPRLARWYYVRDWLAAGYDVLSTDPDVAFLRNPVPHLARLTRAHPFADVFASSDSNTGVYTYAAPVRSGGAEKSVPDDKHGWAVLRAPGERGRMPPTRWDSSFSTTKVKQGFVYRQEHAWRDAFGTPQLIDLLATGDVELGLEDPGNCWPHAYNTGVMMWRASDRARALMAIWLAQLDALRNRPVADDQVPLNAVAKNASTHCARTGQEFIPHGDSAQGLCGDDQMLNAVAGGTACLGILALAQFGNGFTYATARDWEQYAVKPYVFHATYSDPKVMKLREEGLMVDDQEYYRGRFLTYEPELGAEFFPPNIAAQDAPAGFFTWKRHWLLVQHQLKQLKAAAALARALNRTLVLPRMASACECFFYPGKDCVIEGHRVRLPHVMPTDHWLRPNGLARLPHREPGFLQNPRFPRADVESGKTLEVCVPGITTCGSHDGGGRVPARSKDDVVRLAMHTHADTAVVRVVQPLEVFGGFVQESDGRALDDALSGALGAWCCIKNEDRTKWPGADVLQIPYRWEGMPEPIDNGASGAAKCGI